jgi:hypothetical protein
LEATVDTKLIGIWEIAAEVPWWRHSPDATYRMIRKGQLRCVRVGRRKYVTEQLLRDFVHELTVREGVVDKAA